MAIVALQSAASGLSALNTSLDVIANNLANVNTEGFKASRTNFQDLLYIERIQPGVQNALNQQNPEGLFVGLGTRVSGTTLDFKPGAPLNRNRELDVLIDGTGFFRVEADDRIAGGIAYTRSGDLNINSDGELVIGNDPGRRLDPPVTVPADIRGPISISSSGEVFARTGNNAAATKIGDIQVAAFINQGGLRPLGDNLFEQTEASGPPIDGEPGVDGRGILRQGQIEGSNVDPTRELIELIRTQRAFEMNSNTIRTADETLRTVSQLKR
ncbi:MAG: flagellar basal-body rod protein FlgG [Phycisphaerales bacterium]